MTGRGRKIKDRDVLAIWPPNFASFIPSLPFQRNTPFSNRFETMAIVVGSPMPEDQLGPLEPLIAADQMKTRAYCECAHFLRISALNYIRCSGGHCVLILWILWGKIRACRSLNMDCWRCYAPVLTLDREARTTWALLSFLHVWSTVFSVLRLSIFGYFLDCVDFA